MIRVDSMFKQKASVIASRMGRIRDYLISTNRANDPKVIKSRHQLRRDRKFMREALILATKDFVTEEEHRFFNQVYDTFNPALFTKTSFDLESNDG